MLSFSCMVKTVPTKLKYSENICNHKSSKLIFNVCPWRFVRHCWQRDRNIAVKWSEILWSVAVECSEMFWKLFHLPIFCVSIEEHDYSVNLLGGKKGTRLRKTVCKFLCWNHYVRKQNNTINFKTHAHNSIQTIMTLGKIFESQSFEDQS
jgi:hypothetical protein